MTPSRHFRRSFVALAAALVGGVALAACGGGSGPSVASPGAQSGQAVTTSTTTVPTSSTSVPTTAAPATTPTTAVPAGEQLVTYSGLQFEVPSSWPVYQMTADPNRCIRFDVHAAYLGPEGPAPQCPAMLVGATEAMQIETLNPQSAAGAAATQPQTLNGLAVRVDPNSAINGADTVVFPAQGLIAVITYRTDPTLAAQILQSFHSAP